MNKKYKFFESIFLSMAALGIYNCIIQIAVYPYFSRVLGADRFGDALTLIAVTAVLSVSAGVGVNYSRMAISTKYESKNGDYNRYLIVCAAVCAAVCEAALFITGEATPGAVILYPLAAIAIMLRYYADVEFRLTVNYRKYFLFYLILGAASAAGLLLFRLTGRWETVFIFGELFAVSYVVIRGSVFSRPLLAKSANTKAVFSSCNAVAFSQLFATFILNSDRFLINAFLGGGAVTIYYTASLLGKTTALLTGPFNGVVIGFLAKYEKPVTKKFYLLCSAGSLAAGAVLFALFIPLSPFVLKILYPEISGSAAQYCLLANGGQILYFVSNLLLVICLRFMKERYQLYINGVYAAVYFAVCIPALMHGGISAFVAAVFAVNAVRLAAIILLGTVKAKRNLK